MHTYLLRRIPEEVWARAKRVAAARGITLRELLLSILRDPPEERVHTYLFRRIPRDVWDRAKRVARARATTVRELLLAALRELPESPTPAGGRGIPFKSPRK